jgi:hypothetical protein
VYLACSVAGCVATPGRPAPVAAAPAAVDAAPAAPLRREALIGAWRLVAIEYRAADGETLDPFYQARSTGLLIYDPSGWMSVHIAAPGRNAWPIPQVRVPRLPADEEKKAEAFDTYYGYYGTYDFDASSSTVIHHVRSSVIPAENGLDYAQTVSFEAGRLVFTVQSGPAGARSVRRKVWERL